MTKSAKLFLAVVLFVAAITAVGCSNDKAKVLDMLKKVTAYIDSKEYIEAVAKDPQKASELMLAKRDQIAKELGFKSGEEADQAAAKLQESDPEVKAAAEKLLTTAKGSMSKIQAEMEKNLAMPEAGQTKQ